MSFSVGASPGPVFLLPATPAPEPALAGVPVDLAGRVEIFPSAPLPALNTAHAKAYAARVRGESRSSLYALICTEGLPVRGEAFANFMNSESLNLVRFRDQGVIYWPLTDQAEQVVVCARPSGPRLDAIYATAQAPLEDQQLVQFLIRPMADLLLDLAKKGLTHGSIHLGNLFYSQRTNDVQAGEAISAPPSADQPLLYTTIERGQCQPFARGLPASSDDLYALGMTGLIMALGFNPWASMTDEEILQAKIERGSFFGLVGEQRLKGSLIELFRGLLDDNLKRRWTLNDLDTWLGGRRPQARISEGELRPARPFTLSGHEHQNLRSLVHGLAKDPLAASAVIESGELERWLVRTLGSDRHAGLLKKATGTMLNGPRGANFQDHLVARAAIALDPAGPIRFRGLATMPSGIPYALATQMIKGSNVQALTDIINSPLPAIWLDEQYEGRGDHLHNQQQLEQARAYLEKRAIGFGVERVIYESLPAQPCLSPLIRKSQCRTVADALAALEKIAGDNTKRDPLDRHLTAFILAREKRVPAVLATHLAAPEGAPERALAIARLLAEAQAKQGPANLPGLTQWVAQLLEPALKRFHQKELQARVRADLQKLAKSGDLLKLVDAVDNPVLLAEDQREFDIAKQMYRQATQDINDLQLDIQNRVAVEARVGQPIAAGVAVFVGFLAVTMVAMLSVMGVYL